MLISTSHEFVFFCMTKCASNSIETTLAPYSDIRLRGLPEIRHTDYRTFERYIAPYLRETAAVGDLECICLVREPVSWLSSWHRFRSRDALRNVNHPWRHHSTYGISFEEFVVAYLQEPRPAFADVGTQFDFVRDSNQGIGVDTIFAYESMDHFVKYMEVKTGARLKLGYRNVSPGESRSVKVIERIARIQRLLQEKKRIRRTANGIRSFNKGDELPGDLTRQLREHIARDFELHEMAVRRTQHTQFYADDERAAERYGG